MHKVLKNIRVKCFVIVAVTIIACLDSCLYGICEPVNEKTLCLLMEYAENKSTLLLDVIHMDNTIKTHMPNDFVNLIRDEEYSSLRYAIIVLTDSDMIIDNTMKKLCVPLDYKSTICFDILFDINAYGSDDEFAVWSDRSSIIGTVEPDNSFPDIAYTILIYNENAPQIATAFSKTKEYAIVTKTCFIFNKNIYEPLYLAGPYMLESLWGENIHTFIYDYISGELKDINQSE